MSGLRRSEPRHGASPGAAPPGARPGARFPADVLALLEREVEVTMETQAGDGSRRRRVTIWVVVEDGEVFVRSYRGEAGRWYRDLLAWPEAVLVAAGRRFAVRAVRAADPGSIERCSRALRAKYRPSASLAAMLLAEVQGTTLRLVPA
ncbi:MAG TPA: DUF2255 family protein [Candidatus Limnocylindrales bacterium]|nr:DUF2255 family protein [Candidatus Limnocylindrales bacterium]